MLYHYLRSSTTFKWMVLFFLLTTYLLAILAYHKESIILFVLFFLLEVMVFMLELRSAIQKGTRSYQNDIGLFMDETLDLDQAIKAIHSCDPKEKNIETLNLLGICYMYQGKWTQAEECFQKGLKKHLNLEYELLLLLNQSILYLYRNHHDLPSLQEHLMQRFRLLKDSNINKEVKKRHETAFKREQMLSQLLYGEMSSTMIDKERTDIQKRLCVESLTNRQRLAEHYFLAILYLKTHNEEKLAEEVTYLRPHQEQTFFYQDICSRRESIQEESECA